MRKTVETAALLILAILCWITYSALHGPEPLPARIPTHFDISGQPNAWGPPQLLWLLPAIGTGLYLFLTVLGGIRFQRFNLPVPITEANLSFIQDQTSIIVAWIKFEVLCLFTYLQWKIIQGVRAGESHLSPWMVPVFVVVIFATVGWRLAELLRGAKVRAESSAANVQD